MKFISLVVSQVDEADMIQFPVVLEMHESTDYNPPSFDTVVGIGRRLFIYLFRV